jgi:hypothetical protein
MRSCESGDSVGIERVNKNTNTVNCCHQNQILGADACGKFRRAAKDKQDLTYQKN